MSDDMIEGPDYGPSTSETPAAPGMLDLHIAAQDRTMRLIWEQWASSALTMELALLAGESRVLGAAGALVLAQPPARVGSVRALRHRQSRGPGLRSAPVQGLEPRRDPDCGIRGVRMAHGATARGGGREGGGRFFRSRSGRHALWIARVERERGQPPGWYDRLTLAQQITILAEDRVLAEQRSRT
jgi:hypothetical protein